jgi:Na+/phosphate symporter
MGYRNNRSICLSNDVESHIKENMEIESFSAWVENAYKQQFMALDSKQKILKIKEHEVKDLKAEIMSIQERQKSVSKQEKPLSPKEILFFRQFERIGTLQPKYMKFLFKQYNRKFKASITEAQLREKIAKFGVSL